MRNRDTSIMSSEQYNLIACLWIIAHEHTVAARNVIFIVADKIYLFQVHRCYLIEPIPLMAFHFGYLKTNFESVVFEHDHI